MNPLNWFAELGIPENCITKKSSCGEKGRKFSIIPKRGEKVWRVKVDGCWLSRKRKKVDYLFWGEEASGKRIILLVELKGGHYGKALEQVYSTLQVLCKHSYANIAHNKAAIKISVHSPIHERGVQAYIVLSTGKEASQRTSKRGRKIPQHFRKLESIRINFKVRVHPTTNKVLIKGVDSFFKN